MYMHNTWLITQFCVLLFLQAFETLLTMSFVIMTCEVMLTLTLSALTLGLLRLQDLIHKLALNLYPYGLCFARHTVRACCLGSERC